jgi:predicted ArsR family transcriptional regulator
MRQTPTPQSPTPARDPIDAIALLEEPTRRRLYDFVAASQEPLGRDESAASLGISRALAAFHLDRLAGAGLLEVEYRRRSGRTGPGAGRPAKLYRRARWDVAVTLPPRTYDVAADVMATALDRLAGPSGRDAVLTVARERGAAAGADLRRKAGSRPGRLRLQDRLVDALRRSGYEPRADTSAATITLRNCPFDALVAEHRDLTCGMNAAWAEGLVHGLGAQATVELAPEPRRCCVVFHTDLGGTGADGVDR